VDFDDLIGLPLKLLAEYPEVRERWQAKMGHVLVDEYQDTNATQYEVLKHLVGERARFTAVGDDDQSIYGWRGATLDNLKRCRWTFRSSKSSSWSKTTAPPAPSCARPTTSSSPTPSSTPKPCSLNWAKASRCGWSMP
jgi:ATP-dependent DNA helicase Rep